MVSLVDGWAGRQLGVRGRVWTECYVRHADEITTTTQFFNSHFIAVECPKLWSIENGIRQAEATTACSFSQELIIVILVIIVIIQIGYQHF